MQAAAFRRRLTAADSVFLYWQSPKQPMHVAECMVYDGSFSGADLLRMIEQRIHLLPRYRQKIVATPLAIGHPVWVDDADFDVANHVAEMSLPEPADDVVLSKVVGQLFSALLDRDRPLWHATVLHGHESRNTIVFLRLHHAMVDGVSSVDLIEVLHSVEPDARVPPAPDRAWAPQSVPGSLGLVRDAVSDQVGTVLDTGREIAALVRPSVAARRLRQLRVVARTLRRTAPMAVLSPPKTPFNEPITPARQIAWLELDLEEAHQVRRQLDATVNDLVLGILAGGLGRYMRRHGYATDDVVLRSLCPVSMRRADESGALGNLVSLVVAPLFVGIADPVQRLQAERTAMRRLKDEDQAGGLYDLMAMAKWIPAPLYQLMWQAVPKDRWPQNISSTNVPGPRAPVYLDGHELLHWYPVGVQWTNNGLFLCTLSYRQYLTLGFVADPEIVPDLWEAIDDLRASYEEIRKAAKVTRRRSTARAGRSKNGRAGAPAARRTARPRA
jgi:diacylglycerol O-acyltransferase / wax synthase